MRRGRPPQSPAERALNGNVRKDRDPFASSSTDCTLRPADREPPTWLPARAAEVWYEVAPELIALGRLTAVDVPSFCCYCVCVADVQEATKRLAVEGTTIATERGGLKSHPLVALRAQAMTLAKAFGQEFGLLPDARRRLPPPEPKLSVVTKHDYFSDG